MDREVAPGHFAGAMRTFAPFEPRPKIAVAVSGGPDRMCLALLAADWIRDRGGEIRGFVVDHGLRAGSAAEAALVVDRLASLDIPAEVLRWRHGALASRIQQRARDARYALLEEAVAAWGGLHLLVAHHVDDQRETVALRCLRGSGPVGRSGMAAVAERGQIRLLRPLLAMPKAMLLATLRHRGVPWVEDPSNNDLRFARASLRQAGSGSMDPVADASARLRLNDAAVRFLAAYATIGEERSVRFPRAPFRALPADAACYLLGHVLAALGDNGYLPPTAGQARLAAAVGSAADGAMTLGGCLVRFGQRWVRIRPEGVARLPWHPPVPVAPVPFGAGPGPAPILLHSPENLCST